MAKLFDNYPLQDLIDTKEYGLKMKINEYDDSRISSMTLNLDSEIDKLISSCDDLVVPKLQSDKPISEDFDKKALSSYHPIDVEWFEDNDPIDVAIYEVPFTGNPQFFQCNRETPYGSQAIHATINSNSKSLMLECPEYKYKIIDENGNIKDEVIRNSIVKDTSEILKKLRKSCDDKIKIIEDILNELEKDLSDCLIEMKKNLKAHTNEKVKELEKQNDA